MADSAGNTTTQQNPCRSLRACGIAVRDPALAAPKVILAPPYYSYTGAGVQPTRRASRHCQRIFLAFTLYSVDALTET